MKEITSNICFLVISVFIISCTTKKNNSSNRNGYVKKYDTIFNSNSDNMTEIYRTFYQKKPTLHNGLIELKYSSNDSSFYLAAQEKTTNEYINIKIKDINIFFNQTEYILNSNLNNITIALDSTEQTHLRKSLSFDKGIFFIHNYDINKNILFDLSEKDIELIKESYNTYINE